MNGSLFILFVVLAISTDHALHMSTFKGRLMREITREWRKDYSYFSDYISTCLMFFKHDSIWFVRSVSTEWSICKRAIMDCHDIQKLQELHELLQLVNPVAFLME